jgi:hypothetical protein
MKQNVQSKLKETCSYTQKEKAKKNSCGEFYRKRNIRSAKIMTRRVKKEKGGLECVLFSAGVIN